MRYFYSVPRSVLTFCGFNWQIANGAGIIALLALVAFGASPISPYGAWEIAGTPCLPPLSPEHLLGTDMLGRDVLSGVIYGAQSSLLVGLASAGAAIVLGIVVGAFAGYYGGIVDDILMRFTEFLQTMPGLALALVLVAVLGPSIWSVVIAITIVSWAPVARLIRAEFLSLRGREFVLAAIVLGQRNTKIILSQMLPNALGPIVSTASLKVSSAILTESTISFLGLGDTTRMSWGMMIGNAQGQLREAWWMSVFPGVALFVTILGLTLLSDGIARSGSARKQSML
ncbi:MULTISPECIES: ABC transporter permease subunit [Chelativorans]|uniref:Binding-protein-dependent transport systems inner membrane component n=1 Tax=Chelativorans sp. (strain BNC1) TaxID=266779 RepID=Q11KW2_CHESB